MNFLKHTLPALGLLALAAGCGDNDKIGDTGADGTEGTPGANTLLNTTILDVGDENCPNGGTQIDTGLDNGDGGETAGDGVLGAGEVDNTTYLCNGEDEDPVKPLDPPDGPAGQFVIDARGGDSTVGSGSPGGPVSVNLPQGTNGGHVKVFATGVADASFTVPTIAPDLGENPHAVTADATVVTRAAADNTDLVDGSLVLRPSVDATLRRFNGASDDIVTGLSIAAGATLTFEGPGSVNVAFEAGVQNAGTITTALQGDSSRPALTMSMSSYAGAAGSAIALAGGDATAGGAGGPLQIICTDAKPVGVGTAGVFVNEGTITTSGGNGDSGGPGAPVGINAALYIYNTGDITTIGGTAAATSAGPGGPISFNTSEGGIFNAGNLTSFGGDSADIAGPGGPISIFAGSTVLNSGAITGYGGSVDAACTDTCSAGPGAPLTVQVTGGTLRNSGPIDVHGGDSAGGNGGPGAPVFMVVASGGSALGPQFAGNLELSGGIINRGGSGEQGGPGGPININLSVSFALKQELILYGVTDIDLSGGNGVTGGGPGGSLTAIAGGSPGPIPTPGSSIVIEPNLTMTGGAASGGPAGPGGALTLITESLIGTGTESQYILLGGNIDASGGDGVNGGPAAPFYISGLSGVTVSGSLINNGGAGSDSGGDTAGITVRSGDGDVIVAGALASSSGGACTADNCTGGTSSGMSFAGLGAMCSADLATGGGDASATGGDGGNAGSIAIDGLVDGASSTAASVDIVGGSGGNSTGADGQYFVGGVDLTDSVLP